MAPLSAFQQNKLSEQGQFGPDAGRDAPLIPETPHGPIVTRAEASDELQQVKGAGERKCAGP